MSNRWMVALAAGAAISMAAPSVVEAQGASQTARGRQQQPQRASDQERRAAERAEQQRQREASQRDSRAANQRRDERDRQDSRPSSQAREAEQRQRAAERDRASERDREAERERLRIERERQAQRDRLQAERYRQSEYDRLMAERRRQAEQERLATERRRQAERDRMRRMQWARYDWDNYRNWSGSGPAFCRAGGYGHPVWGRQWCRDKGFSNRYDRWDDYGWRTIDTRRRHGRDYDLGRSVLIDILGDSMFRRFEAYGRQYYGAGSLTGDWFDDTRGSILQISIGGVPFVRLLDTNRDGRIDDVLLRR